MNNLVLDATTRDRFNGLDQFLRLCDEAGNTLGYYLPPSMEREAMYAFAKSEFSDAEIEAAREDYRLRGGMTTKEALEYVEKVIREKQGGS